MESKYQGVHTHGKSTRKYPRNCQRFSLEEFQEYIALEHDIALSRSRIGQLIRDAGLTYKLLRRCAAERSEHRHAEFIDYCTANLMADMIISVDKSSKDDRTLYRHYGRSRAGTRACINANFVRGTRWSILPAMTVDGYLAVELIEGSVNGIIFLEFIVDKVVHI